MTKLVPFTTDEKLALLALLNLSGFNVVDTAVILLRISLDCVANNVIIRCILMKARVYRTRQIVKLQSC